MRTQQASENRRKEVGHSPATLPRMMKEKLMESATNSGINKEGLYMYLINSNFCSIFDISSTNTKHFRTITLQCAAML